MESNYKDQFLQLSFCKEFKIYSAENSKLKGFFDLLDSTFC